MAVKELNIKEQHYADTRDEAEKVVEDAKQDLHLMMHKITEKHNKYGQYFLVDLHFSYNNPKEIMENAANKPAEEPKEKGIEYEVKRDGIVELSKEDEE